MHKVLVFVILFALINFITGFVTGGDRGERRDDYFPLREGNKWSYFIRSPGLSTLGNATLEVTKAKVNFVLTINPRVIGYPDDTVKLYLRPSSQGIAIYKIFYKGEEKVYDKPQLIFKHPLKKDDEWEATIIDEEVKFKNEGEEKINTKYGKFNCFKIKVTPKDEANWSHALIWLAKGKGIVKLIFYITNDIHAELNLTKFQKSKK